MLLLLPNLNMGGGADTTVTTEGTWSTLQTASDTYMVAQDVTDTWGKLQ